MANKVEVVVTGEDDTSPAFRSATKNAEDYAKSITKAGEVMKGALAADLVQEGARKVKEAIDESIKAASDLEQSVGGTKAVFKEAAGEIEEFGKTSAETVGLSENEFRELTTGVGGQLKRMTGDLGEAADMTLNLTKIAADLAATYGGTTKEAMEAFSAALRGEADPAERFNLNLKVGAVQAKAVEMGLAKTTTQVSQAAQAQALYALILDQSKDAQGQFNRETDSAAHKQQVANAEIENAKAKLGEGLLPVYAAAATAVATLADWFSKLPGPVQASIAVLGSTVGAFLILIPKIMAAKTAIQEMNITLAGTKAFLAGPWGIAIMAAVGLVGAFALSQRAAASRAAELADALDLQKGALDENNRATIANRLEKEGLLKTAQDLGVNTQDLISAILGDKDAQDRLNMSTIQLNKNSDEATVKRFKFNQAIKQMIGDVDAASEATDRQTEATKVNTDAEDANKKAIQEQTKALQDQAKAIEDQFDPMAKLIHANQDVTEKQNAYNKAVKEHGRNSAEAKAANLELAAAVIEAQSAAAGAAGTFDGKLTPALKGILKSGGLTEQQIKDIEKQFAAARKEGDKYAKNYPATATLKVIVHEEGYAEYRAGERNPGKHAYGGVATGGVPIVINDASQQGEIIHAPDGSYIIPAGQSASLFDRVSGHLSGGAGTAIRIELPRTTGMAWLDSLIQGIQYKVQTDGGGDVNYLAGKA